MQQITEPFVSGSSIIHTSHPGVRVGCAFLLSLAGALVTTLPAACAVLITGILFAATARLPFFKLLKRLLFINFFILFLWAFLPFSHVGEPVFSIGPFTATLEGIIYSAIITLKSNGVVLAVTALISTMPAQLVGAGMQTLRLPDKLCRLFLFTWRYVHVMGAEFSKMNRAATMRGFIPRTDMHTYRTYAWLMGMLLIRSLDRAQRIWQAMLCRGFTGTFHTLNTFQIQGKDRLIMALSLVCASAFIFLELYKIEVFR
ncbi:cobalt ECF transporter T component CbiQ [Maridesulfovibrio hydrothermalis]|uniref:Cobalt ABC transporter, inner membrane subunit CbiQ n=1 Tax=Maridesulfovibrio hydrothermalis AM13 = DSM 14728 TaxID=1121451 RepID=L0R9T6_9BACT|nr:cobalt ECF transporter T component CbiQ [Maridesulfovibrio hydrothermalis]CCO23543.1 Cobalt ABC transporter, inner membrane subunit CbiQ [Maridesulfovibrio hydrothermalis AM13 = DSM 14728]